MRQAVQLSSRPFSTTSRQDQRTSRARRAFFHWIATRGLNFKNPLAGSTNYLGAYTKDGQLRRVLRANREKEELKAIEEASIALGKPYTPPEADPPRPKETPDEPPNKLHGWKKRKADEAAAKAGDTPRLGEGEGIAELTPVIEELPAEQPADLTPFPLNKSFSSQPVLSEKFRKKIWEAIILEGMTVREASAKFNVEMSRVGAVVRLMEVQKEWERIKKPLALPYAEAIMSMLPKTLYLQDQDVPGRKKPHESINDLPVHRATGQQIFHPTSESRLFTRKDAAKVFHDKLLPADDRIPHPDLVVVHRDIISGIPEEEVRKREAERRTVEEEKEKLAAELLAKQEAAIKRVDTGRWEYRFTNISVESAGKDGRGRRGTGWRYGAPHMDRKKGAVRIPTAV